jgi:hypothetical protein
MALVECSGCGWKNSEGARTCTRCRIAIEAVETKPARLWPAVLGGYALLAIAIGVILLPRLVAKYHWDSTPVLFAVLFLALPLGPLYHRCVHYPGRFR